MDEVARGGNPEAVSFPRAFLEDGSYDFSFSGLKTAVANYVKKAGSGSSAPSVADVAASFQEAVVDVLATKTIRAAKDERVRTVALAGGVAANSRLREELARRAGEEGLELVCPSPVLCTDNAAMVACAGYFRLARGERSPLDLPAIPDLDLD